MSKNCFLDSNVGILTEHKSEWAISNSFFALQDFKVENDSLCFFSFPIWLVSHIPPAMFTTCKQETYYFRDKSFKLEK